MYLYSNNRTNIVSLVVTLTTTTLTLWGNMCSSFMIVPNKNGGVGGRPVVVVHHQEGNVLRKQKRKQDVVFAPLALSLDDELEDLDRARSEFERCMKEGEEETSTITTSRYKNDLPLCKDDYIPIVTETSRRRREVEMELLSSLVDSDDAIDELMSLWMVERDVESAKQLQRMEEICSPGLVEEEAMLRSMIDSYGIHWAEPVSRLAAILYYKGRTTESMYWCKVALAVKPWHFETAHTLVMNCLREQNLGEAVRTARSHSLPSLSQPNKRKAWVTRALQDAQDALDRGQQERCAATSTASAGHYYSSGRSRRSSSSSSRSAGDLEETSTQIWQ